MTIPKVGEIRPVSGGYGLMLVAEYDAGLDAAGMRGHGSATFTRHWFFLDRLGEPVGREVVLRERAEARARNVECDDPDCWCRKFDRGADGS